MFSSFFKNFFNWSSKKNEKHLTVMLIGLDNSGKSTLLSSIQGTVDHDTMPTVGFDREIVKHGNYHITYFDLGGGENIRSLWSAYFANVHAAIYVIDSSDEKRMDEARRVLLDCLQHDYFKGKTVLFFANKQDLGESLSAEEIAQRLRLHELDIQYNILGITAKTPKGTPTDPNIKRGLTWLGDALSKDFDQLDNRVRTETQREDERKSEEKRIKFERIRKRKEEEARQQEETGEGAQ
mmetsp:Transcript_2556/g.9681  ORF Transcript_2556/g.9681 Transcript_2556/m.9681 type:complete len:238 (+) Transcript_2556:363-1076(+)